MHDQSEDRKINEAKSRSIAAKLREKMTAGQLRSVIERVERLKEERRDIAEAIKEVFAEAKANGFDVKTLRKIVSLRRLSDDERDEGQAMLDLYMSALGMREAA